MRRSSKIVFIESFFLVPFTILQVAAFASLGQNLGAAAFVYGLSTLMHVLGVAMCIIGAFKERAVFRFALILSGAVLILLSPPINPASVILFVPLLIASVFAFKEKDDFLTIPHKRSGEIIDNLRSLGNKYCPKCGTSLSIASEFCPQCGSETK